MKRLLTLALLLFTLSFSSMAQFCDKNDYQYFYSWLSKVASTVTPDKVDMFGEPSLINYGYVQLGAKVPAAADAVEVSKFSHGDQTVYIWKFTRPTDIPLPYYMAFIPRGDHYVTVQLELSLDDAWVLGETEDRSHANYGTVKCPDNAEGFLKLIKDKKILK